MDGVRVDSGAVVSDSIVGWGATVGAGARVADRSIVGEGYVVEAGARLSEARRPEPA
jgi:NDP-sugar pyrophosphorylase family protein